MRERNRILPDGRIDIIFNLAEPLERADGSKQRPVAYVVGTMRHAATFLLRAQVDILGVRFKAGGATALLGVAAHELTDQVAEMHDIWPASGGLHDRLLEAGTTRARLDLVEGALLARARDVRCPHPVVVAATRLIDGSHGRISMRHLSDQLAMSPRHLRRVFADWVGIPPKLAARIARFQRAASALRSDGDGGWARLALECGYHDQAHLIRDFRELAGLTPGAYLHERADGRFVQYGPGRSVPD